MPLTISIWGGELEEEYIDQDNLSSSLYQAHQTVRIYPTDMVNVFQVYWKRLSLQLEQRYNWKVPLQLEPQSTLNPSQAVSHWQFLYQKGCFVIMPPHHTSRAIIDLDTNDHMEEKSLTPWPRI